MKKYILIIFFVIYAFLAFYRKYLLGLICVDIDEYMIHFKDFINIGYYAKVAEGTTITYNLVLSWIHFFVQDVSNSFFYLNVFCQAIMAILGFLIIKKNNYENKKYLNLFGLYFVLLWVNDEQHTLSRNDLFLGVLMMVIYYLIFIKDLNIWKSVLVGFILGLLLSTRLFSIILIPSIFLYILINNHKNKIKNISIIVVVFIITLLSFNYPSIKEHQKLSFYDKNKGISENAGFTWNDINTLATLRMFDENKIELLTKNMYWGWNKTKIEQYKKQYKIEESPTSIFEFIVEYPIYYIKLVLLNLLNVFLYLFRRYAFMLLLPFLYTYLEIKQKKINFIKKKESLPFLMFIVSTGILIGILNTVIEFRWLVSIEFLVLFSIFLSYKSLLKRASLNTKVNYVLYSSLVCLTILNIKTIISTL